MCVVTKGVTNQRLKASEKRRKPVREKERGVIGSEDGHLLWAVLED